MITSKRFFLKCHSIFPFQKAVFSWQCFWSSFILTGPSNHCQLSWASAGCSRSSADGVAVGGGGRRSGSGSGTADDVVGPGGDDRSAVRKQLVVALTNHERPVAGNWLQLHFVESTDRLVSGDPAEVCLPACVLFAGVDAVVVFTGLVLGAVLINLTLTLSALDAGIAKRSRGTGTGESARWGWGALSSGAAGVGVTWIWGLNTHLVLANKAGLTVGVSSTLWTTSSDCVWLGHEPSQASANGVAKLVCHAHGSWTAGRGVAGVGLLNATLVFADKTPLAVGIPDALGSASSDGIRLWNQTRLASADWVAVAVDLASGAWAAGRWVTGVWLLNASLVLADKATFTVGIPHTLGATSSDGVWFWDQAFLAPANGVTQAVDHAGGVGATGRRVTGVGLLDAPLVFAYKSIFTVGVTNAFWATSGNGVRLGYQPLLTPANWVSQTVDHASGPWPARGWVAWVWLLDAALVVTDKAPVAVGVPHALWPAAGDGVRFGNEVGDAPADGVAVGALGAGSVGSTGGGVAGVLWHLPNLGRRPAKIEVLGICGPQQGQAY